MFHLKLVNYTFKSVWVAEWPPFGKKLPARLTIICSHCLFSICNIIYFPFLDLRKDLDIDCSISRSLLFYYFSSFFQVTRTTLWSQISSKLGQIQPWTAELAVLERLKKSFTYLRTIQNILMTCWLSGVRSLPFGLLVIQFYLLLNILNLDCGY